MKHAQILVVLATLVVIATCMPRREYEQAAAEKSLIKLQKAHATQQKRMQIACENSVWGCKTEKRDHDVKSIAKRVAERMDKAMELKQAARRNEEAAGMIQKKNDGDEHMKRNEGEDNPQVKAKKWMEAAGIGQKRDEEGMKVKKNEEGMKAKKNEEGIKAKKNEEGVKQSRWMEAAGIGLKRNEEGMKAKKNEEGMKAKKNEEGIKAKKNEEGVKQSRWMEAAGIGLKNMIARHFEAKNWGSNARKNWGSNARKNWGSNARKNWGSNLKKEADKKAKFPNKKSLEEKAKFPNKKALEQKAKFPNKKTLEQKAKFPNKKWMGDVPAGDEEHKTFNFIAKYFRRNDEGADQAKRSNKWRHPAMIY